MFIFRLPHRTDWPWNSVQFQSELRWLTASLPCCLRFPPDGGFTVRSFRTRIQVLRFRFGFNICLRDDTHGKLAPCRVQPSRRTSIERHGRLQLQLQETCCRPRHDDTGHATTTQGPETTGCHKRRRIRMDQRHRGLRGDARHRQGRLAPASSSRHATAPPARPWRSSSSAAQRTPPTALGSSGARPADRTNKILENCSGSVQVHKMDLVFPQCRSL